MSHLTCCMNAQTAHFVLAGVVLTLEALSSRNVQSALYVVRNAMQAFNMTGIGAAESNVPLHLNPHYL